MADPLDLTELLAWKNKLLRTMDEAYALGFTECEITLPPAMMIPMIVHLGECCGDGGWDVPDATTIRLTWDKSSDEEEES